MFWRNLRMHDVKWWYRAIPINCTILLLDSYGKEDRFTKNIVKGTGTTKRGMAAKPRIEGVQMEVFSDDE